MSDPIAVRPLDRPPHTTVMVPGSKSLTNRALVLAALCAGSTRLAGALDADDTEAMLGCLRALGVEVSRHGSDLIVDGPGRFTPTDVPLDARLSGTTSRFLLPVLAGQPGEHLIDGQPPLRRRPFGDLVSAVRALGGEIDEQGEPGCLPLLVRGKRLNGGPVDVPLAATSQFASALLLAGPTYRDGVDVRLVGPAAHATYVVMTLDVLGAFGASVHGLRVGGPLVSPGSFQIEPDASAAAYFWAVAAVTGGTVTVPGIGRSSRQGDARFALDVLGPMGCDVRQTADGTTVVGPPSGRLRGGTFDLAAMPDQALTLAAIAPFADSPVRVDGVAVIRGHETDRIAAIVAELGRLGIDVDERPDGFTVHPGPVTPATVETYDDHRVAMSFAVTGLVADGIRIAEPGCVAKTYPRFFEALDHLR